MLDALCDLLSRMKHGESKGGALFSCLRFCGRREVDGLAINLCKAHESSPSRGFFPLVALGLKIRVAMGAVQGDGEPEEIGITVKFLGTLRAFYINNVHGYFLA